MQAFERIGTELKQRRVRDYQMDFGCTLTDETIDDADPADADEELSRKLKENDKVAEERTRIVFEKYTT